MWTASRTPHSTVSTSARPLTIPSPAPSEAANAATATAAKPSPHATSTTACRPSRSATTKVTPSTTTTARTVNGSGAEELAEGEGGQQRHQTVRTRGRLLRPSGVGLTIRIWSTPIRPSSKASAPPTR